MNFEVAFKKSSFSLTIIVLVSVVSFISCQPTESNKNQIEEATFLSRYDYFSDQIERYYASIHDVAYSDFRLYFVDNDAGRIFVSDDDLKYLFEFGSKGEGPNEIRSLGKLVINENHLIMPDYLGRKFMIFDKSGSPKTVISPVLHGISNSNFSFDERELIFYDKRADSIKFIDLKTNSTGGFSFPWSNLGLSKPLSNPEISLYNIQENIFFIIHDRFPFVGLLDKKGKQLGNLNLSDLPMLQGMMTKQRALDGTNSSLVFFNDSQMLGNKIYLIIGTRDAIGENAYYNHLISIKVDGKDIELDEIIKLNESRWYTCFEIIPQTNQIIVYDASQKYIDRYFYNLNIN